MNLLNNSHLAQLKEYIPGRSIAEIAEQYGIAPKNIIKLGSNENPLGASPKAIAALKEAIAAEIDYKNNLSFYPDALGQSLAKAIRQKFPEIGSAEIIIGNGMDNILEGLARLLLSPGDQAIIHTPTFEYYEIVTRWAKAEPIFIKTFPEKNFEVDAEEIVSKLSPKVKIIFLCSPNNPTGSSIRWSDIKYILEEAQKYNAYVFLDEAYTEFSGQTNIHNVQNFPNLIIGRTFSKLYGLAALRIGWALIPQAILSSYRKVQTPFSTNLLGLMAAEVALSDTEFISKSLKINSEGLAFLNHELSSFGFKTYLSQGNFIAFSIGEKFNYQAKELCSRLLSMGVILRNASIFRDAPPDLIRLTIGTANQNQKVIESIKVCLA